MSYSICGYPCNSLPLEELAANNQVDGCVALELHLAHEAVRTWWVGGATETDAGAGHVERGRKRAHGLHLDERGSRGLGGREEGENLGVKSGVELLK